MPAQTVGSRFYEPMLPYPRTKLRSPEAETCRRFGLVPVRAWKTRAIVWRLTTVRLLAGNETGCHGHAVGAARLDP